MKFDGKEPPPAEIQLDPLQRDDDGLWDLLGQAKPVEVSPFFARNVLREVRLAKDQSPSLSLSLLFRRCRLALVGAAALAVVGINGLVILHEGESNALAQHSAESDQVANLDEFLAYEPTSGWLGDQPN